MTPAQRKANRRLALILASVALVFALGFVGQDRRCLAHEQPRRTAARQPRACSASWRSSPRLMFAFGYALVPLYESICEALGINVLSLSASAQASVVNRSAPATRRSTVSRTITVEFDANARGPWELQAGAAHAAGASGRTRHGDVRVQQRAEPHDGRAGDPELRAASRPPRTSTSWSASASTSTRWRRARAGSGRWCS